MEKSTEAVDMGLKSDSFANLAEKNMLTSGYSVPEAYGKHDGPSQPTSCISPPGDDTCISPPGDDTSSIKEGKKCQGLVADQGVYHPSTSDHGYYAPGYDGGTHPEWDEPAHFLAGDGIEMPFSGVESDTGPMFYYMPGYGPYNLAALLDLDEQCVGQQSFFPSSGCLQPPVPNGSEAVSSYTDSQNRAAMLTETKPNVSAPSPSGATVLTATKPNVSAPSPSEAAVLTATKPNVSAPSPSGAAVLTVTKPNASAPRPSGAAVLTATKPNVSAPSPSASLKLKGMNSTKTKGTSDTKASAPPSDSKSRASIASSNFLNSSFHSQPMKPANKVSKEGSTFQSSALPKRYHPMGKFSSFSSQGNGGSSQQNGFRNFRPDGQSFVRNDRFHMREKFDREGVYDSSNVLKRGPRALRASQLNTSSSSSEKTQLSSSIRRDQYNLKDFETRYEQAMFFVIKSFSEDDIHKSIKYNVWASTHLGNKKLDASFHDAETRSSNKGTVCPIFLFFSVNASGQFVGLAEMIGQVDFKKNMDFWQFNGKWGGFFPLKWHMIKDIPNNQFLHIILENNDYNSVTFSKDTQEIGFPQGLEMLKIFKNYPAKTSILDDFDFYEDQEKLKSSGHSLAHSRTNYSSSQKHLEIVGARKAVEASTREEQQKHLQTVGARKVEEASIRAKQQMHWQTAVARKVDEALARANRTYMDPKPPLITLTKNLSLDANSSHDNATMKVSMAKHGNLTRET